MPTSSLRRVTGKRPKRTSLTSVHTSPSCDAAGRGRSRAWWSVVTLALGLSFRQSATYQATAEVLMRQRSTESLFTDDQLRNSADAERALNNEIELLESGAVQAAVDGAYDGPLLVGSVSARPASDRSDAVRISATGGDPNAVAELVNTYTSTYIEFSRSQRVDDLLAAGGEIQAQVDDLQAQIDAASAPLAEIDAQISPRTLRTKRCLPVVRALRRASLQRPTLCGASRTSTASSSRTSSCTAGIVQSGGVQLLTRG